MCGFVVVVVIVDVVMVVVVVEIEVVDELWKMVKLGVFTPFSLHCCSAVNEYNSFDFENWLMGLDVLESLFYGLSTLCYAFLHLKCRKIVNRV